MQVAPVVDSDNQGPADGSETYTNEAEETTDAMESTKIDTDGCSTENKDKASRDCDEESCAEAFDDDDVTQIEVIFFYRQFPSKIR